MEALWEVYALKYATRGERVRAESFIFDDNHDAPHAIDYFIWVIKREDEVIVVDTGFDTEEAERRARPILREPAAALAALNIAAEDVTDLIITHLHYDHAGGLRAFPNAKIHLQEAEMAYATGACMCHEPLKMPFTADHVCEMVQRVYSGRVKYYDGDGAIADGVTVHKIGGHTRGLQVVRVKTGSGWMCLASDATHYYENAFALKPFPIVVDLQDMLDGFAKLEALASNKSLIIPGHDPLVCDLFPALDNVPFVFRLDKGPLREIEFGG